MAEQPNDASRKSKAEGERWDEEPERSGISARPGRSASEVSSGRDPDAVARRREAGELRYGGPLHTPRRYDQPIEDDDDPVMPADDSTMTTKI
jgi:hypothetical protein